MELPGRFIKTITIATTVIITTAMSASAPSTIPIISSTFPLLLAVPFLILTRWMAPSIIGAIGTPIRPVIKAAIDNPPGVSFCFFDPLSYNN